MDVETLIASLRAGELSAEARHWLVDGLEAWQHGQPLEDALGLHSPPLDRRDDLLRLVLQLTPGGSDTARCAFLLDCLSGVEHPSPMAARMLEKLRASGVQVPRSIKHLRRILAGSRRDVGTEKSVLCPSWSRPQTEGNQRGK